MSTLLRSLVEHGWLSFFNRSRRPWAIPAPGHSGLASSTPTPELVPTPMMFIILCDCGVSERSWSFIVIQPMARQTEFSLLSTWHSKCGLSRSACNSYLVAFTHKVQKLLYFCCSVILGQLKKFSNITANVSSADWILCVITGNDCF